MRSYLHERNLAALLFIIVIVVFSFAQRAANRYTSQYSPLKSSSITTHGAPLPASVPVLE